MTKTALITGGARRIGRSIALSLAEMKYAVALHYNTSEEDARKTAGKIRETGAACETFKCELGKEDELLSLIPTVIKKFPELALLVNNASVFEKGTISATHTGTFNRHFDINFKAPYFLMRDFAQSCKKGHIINILDARTTHTDYAYAAYTLSKKALAELTKMAAVEFAPEIRVNAIAPGIILPPSGKSSGFLDRKSKNIPLKRKGATSDIVRALQFLIENEFITGQIIYVDGGENL